MNNIWTLCLFICCSLSLFLVFSQKAIANENINTPETNDQIAGTIGVVIDQSSRMGKEAKVAMHIAIKDATDRMNHSFHLHMLSSERNLFRPSFTAEDLINTHKVQAIVGPHTWEETQLVADIGNQAHIPVLSLAGATPTWAADRWPLLVQAAPNNFVQMKAIAAIIDSREWHRVTVIYEERESSIAGIIPHLYHALRESGVKISDLLPISPIVSSSSSMTKQLERIKNGQCRVILVRLSLPIATKLFERAKEMEMMQKDYVWITTDTFTNHVHSIGGSSISSMQEIVGVKSYFPKYEPHFRDFYKQFRKLFISEFPEEYNYEPGIYAVRAYDAILTVCQAMIESKEGGKKLLDTILGSKIQGLSGKIEFIGQKLAPMHTFQIINVVGKSYRTVGYWSDVFGFSKNVDGKVTNSSSMTSLGPVLWPGSQLTIPRGWSIPTKSNPLKIGVPNGATFEEVLTVRKGSGDDYIFEGYAIELFNLTVRNLPYYLPCKFYPFNGSYDDLVKEIHLKRFDAAVGDISIVSNRFEYVEFTYPYTQSGLVMVVPVQRQPYKQTWLFMKPFTKYMWILTLVITIYNGFVVWLIERSHSSELRGSALNQIGTLIWLSFSTLFSLHGEKLRSNLSRMAMVVWLFVALVITQTYTANLSSILTVKKLEPTVTNIETLKRSDAVVGYCRGSYLRTYLVDVLGFKRDNLRNYSSSNDYAEALRNRELEAIFLDYAVAKLFIAKYCNEFSIVGPTYKVGGFGFAFPRGSELIPDINKSLLNIIETGKLRDLEKDILERAQCKEENSDDQETSSISATSYWVLFVLSGGTSTVALAVYGVVHCCQKLEASFLETIWKLMFTVIKRRGLSMKDSNIAENSTNTFIRV